MADEETLATREQELTREAILAGVGAAANHLAEVGSALIQQIRWSSWQRRFVLAAICFMIFLLFTQIFIGLGNRATGNSIRSCTEITGACYQRQIAQQARIIAELEQRQIVQSWCAKISTAYPDLLSCVVRLSSQTGRKGGTP